MKTYILIDIYNIFHRAMHTNSASKEDMEGMLLHTIISMMKKSCDKFNPNHLIICADGNGTWRKSLYPAYKANRLEKLQDKKPSEIERENILKAVFEKDFLPFLKEKTNMSFLACKNAEADDLIARFCALHPNDNKIILSTDNDFVQLLNDTTIIYNSMEDRLITKDGIISSMNNKPIKFQLKNGKISVSMKDPLVKKGEPLIPMENWVQYALFTKCIRGDSSDNIFSAYPKITEKSTSKKVGMLDAFLEKDKQGFNWNTFMNQHWTNPFGETIKVADSYEFNRKLVDLDYIPTDLQNEFDKAILESLNTNDVGQVGIKLLKYLNKWNLKRLEENASSFSKYFSATYNS